MYEAPTDTSDDGSLGLRYIMHHASRTTVACHVVSGPGKAALIYVSDFLHHWLRELMPPNSVRLGDPDPR